MGLIAPEALLFSLLLFADNGHNNNAGHFASALPNFELGTHHYAQEMTLITVFTYRRKLISVFSFTTRYY